MNSALNRRGFLKLFGITAAAIVADPEILVWTPGEKTIFLPPLAPRLATLEEINAIAMKMIPRLADLVFQQSPFFAYMRDRAGVRVPVEYEL